MIDDVVCLVPEFNREYGVRLRLVSASAWKSGPKTGKKPRPDRDQTALGPQIHRTSKDRNRGPVFGPL